MAPAMSSARPPKMTTRVLPRADRPAVRAKGTVRPSERPMVASEMTRAVTWKPLRESWESLLMLVNEDETSLVSSDAACASTSTKVAPDPSLARRS